MSGTVDGRQLRKQFQDLIDATNWAAAEARVAALTTLAPEVVSNQLRGSDQREAVAVFRQLREEYPGASLTQVWEFYRQCQSIPNRVTLGEAVAEYAAEREVEFERQELSSAHARRLARFLKETQQNFGEETDLSTIQRGQLLKFIEGKHRPWKGKKRPPTLAVNTYNNRKGYLAHFFDWAVDHEYLKVSPLEGVKSKRRKVKKTPDGESAIKVMPVETAAKLMRHVETNYDGRLVPYFALCLFAGIRPDWQEGEISRIRPKMFDFEDSVIRMPKGITKTGKPRDIVLEPNLRAWLEAFPLEEHPIICRNFKKLRLEVRKRFGVTHDELRHTYISMLVADKRSVAEAALSAGNTEGIIWSHYLRLGISRTDAEGYWKITPSQAALS